MKVYLTNKKKGMKKIIIASLALFSVFSVQAQKNSILLGTDFSYKRVNGFNDEKNSEVEFTPVIAYEIADNWFIGAKTAFKWIKNTINDEEHKNYGSKVGGFVRYYKPFNDTFGVYADLGAGYQEYRSDYKDTQTNVVNVADRYRVHGYYIDFVPALFINFKNNFGLNVSFGGIEWNDSKANQAFKYDDSDKNKEFDLTFGKAIKVGVTKKFSF